MTENSSSQIHQNYIAGKWQDPVSGQTYLVSNPPHTSQVIGQFQSSLPQDAKSLLLRRIRLPPDTVILNLFQDLPALIAETSVHSPKRAHIIDRAQPPSDPEPECAQSHQHFS